MAGSQNIGEQSDNPVAINITAMVDVIFCLCLFFMCSFHFKQLEGKIDTWLPKDKGMRGDPSPVLVKDEVRILFRWDPTTGTQRKVMNYENASSDEELMQQVLQLKEGFEARGNTSWPLILDAKNDVPWQDVVHVMDLSKREGIERLEFAAGEIEIKQIERP